MRRLLGVAGAHLTEHIAALPGVEILCPGLQNVGKPDGEVAQGDDGICPDDGESGALQHREHEADVFLTRGGAVRRVRNEQQSYSNRRETASKGIGNLPTTMSQSQEKTLSTCSRSIYLQFKVQLAKTNVPSAAKCLAQQTCLENKEINN